MPRFPRPIRFIAVGCAAALTHLAVVMALVTQLGLAPLAANIAGWMVAFVVSFAGHYRITFMAQHAPALRAFMRFFLVSAIGFTINEIAYAVLLRWTWLPYDAALALVLAGIAMATYLASRHWAFKSTATP